MLSPEPKRAMKYVVIVVNKRGIVKAIRFNTETAAKATIQQLSICDSLAYICCIVD